MTTLTTTTNATCVSHKAHKESISYHNDIAYTFCENCEQNIESWYMDYDSDRLSGWSSWKVAN